MSKINVEQLNGMALAYLGDAIYTAYIRYHLLEKGYNVPTKLHRLTTQYVSAKAQAYLITCMKQDKILNETELFIFNKGRNAKTNHKAKNADILTYHISTGFEAVFGYLQIKKQNDRIQELVDFCINKIEEKNETKR